MEIEPDSLLGALQEMTQGDWDAMAEEVINDLSHDAHALVGAWTRVAERADLEIARRHAVKVPSSDNSTTYEVWFEPYPHCTCRGFQHRGTCRHLAAAREVPLAP